MLSAIRLARVVHMDQAIHEFLDHLRSERGCSVNTLLAYQADLRQFADVVSGGTGKPASLPDLNAASLELYLAWLTGRGYRPSTVCRKVAAIRSFLDYHGRRENGAVPGLLGVLRAPPVPKQRPRVLTRAEVQALLGAPSRQGPPRSLRDAAILSLLYATGMRATEVVGLRIEDVDLARGLVFRRAEDTGEDQAIPLGEATEPVRHYLQEARPHLARDPEEPALFLNQRGQHLSRQGLWLVIRRWAAEAGLSDEVSPHTLRHTLAHHLLEAGRTRRQVQRLLGLSSPNTLGDHDDRNLSQGKES